VGDEFKIVVINSNNGDYEIIYECDTNTEAEVLMDCIVGLGDEEKPNMSEYKTRGYDSIHLIEPQGGIPISVYF